MRVPGFRAAGVHCGIKEAEPDLALIVSDGPAAAAGLFTRSSVVGAPVELCRAHLRTGRARAVVANSGISNVAMGARGRRDAAEMARCAAAALDAHPTEILVASTGVIGEPLPMARVRRGIRAAAAAANERGLAQAAEAIRTTDTFAKTAVSALRIGGRTVTVAGVAKGSGMIEPNLATMLAFLVTDASASPGFLRRVLRAAADASFNRLTVDGETSTSDTLLLLAGGAAGNPVLRGPASPGARRFAAAVAEVSVALARDLARDGEGATKLVTVRVEGARTRAEAERAARRVANSLLVKTALFGGDANWGRVLQTVGAANVALRLDRSEVKLCGVVVFRRGAATGPAARRRAAAKLRAAEVEVAVRLGAGRASARLWTCDLSTEYVRINAEYTT
ncbi:MAG: bifunctional glutamate N-acetyltransferase/amino-acid acetyltransferase ArgJ [Myxococcales bacterium]|nr:bifunctional glutamate N-acetyltransferase/amino-acid acetyltransferase ArgJ [Myxococcales bacterium]